MMCSFAKFLALGLIASEGHGPVSVAADAAAARATYKEIVGKQYPNNTDNEAKITIATCNEMYEAYKSLKPPLADTTTPTINNTQITGMTIHGGKVNACNATAFTTMKTAMKQVWLGDASTLGLTIASNAKVDGTANNIKVLMVAALQKRYESLNSSNSLSLPNDKFYSQLKALKKALYIKRGEEYYTQIQKTYATFDDNKLHTEQLMAVKSALSDAQNIVRIWRAVQDERWEAKSIAEEALRSNSNDKLRQQAVNIKNKALAYQMPVTLADANLLLTDAENLVKEANAVLAQNKQEREEATLGGVFGVLAAAVVGAFIFLVSPCMMLNWDNATVKGNQMWSRDVKFYGEKYGKDDNGEEIRGLDGKEIKESETKEGSALTLVPVGVLAVGVLAVARRGLNKRRAQKKAKRASRAQERLHEDL